MEEAAVLLTWRYATRYTVLMEQQDTGTSGGGAHLVPPGLPGGPEARGLYNIHSVSLHFISVGR